MEKQPVFKQFPPEDIYAGIVFKGPDLVIPHKTVYCEIQSRQTGIELLDRFIKDLNSHGHHYPQWYARRLGLHTQYFGPTITTLTGLPCSAFIDKYLLLFITDLLSQTDDNISEIAHRAGFPRPSELSQFLQRVCRQTPSQLRHNSRKRPAHP
ncbi:helix-turn-helix domain-containing protein [Odoribacter lunatus]|uniref:helix-turn-helix domain-containing protein n=1 Tax=Odoribacter lunatus TaxID=2941335 RepID=UPI003B97605B